jgi:CYTH domain-containing protein
MSSKIEIERKFLVLQNDFIEQASAKHSIIQGYLCTTSSSTVRIRLKDDIGIITIKGKSKDSGLSRFEWELEIDRTEALQLLKLCQGNHIIKDRYEIPSGNHIVEVDVFYGDNEGLILAEIELKSNDEIFEKPVWLGKEVTGDKRFSNSNLISYPFKYWKEKIER